MSEVEGNIGPGLGDGWIKVGAGGVRSVGWENWLMDDGGREDGMSSGNCGSQYSLVIAINDCND